MALIRDNGPVDMIAWLVTALAAVNWGIQEITGEGIFVSAGLTGDALTSVYILVGVLGLINLLSWVETYVVELDEV